jgi:alpha-L-fucosidase
MGCMFSDGGPDIRWVGNESGTAGKTCWATLNAADFAPGNADGKRLNSGDRPGTHWLPAECDVSIRPGWFYHEREDAKVKTPRQLLDFYYASVGRGATLLLNLPPDRRGQLHETDVKSLLEFRRLRDTTFERDLAAQAKVTGSSTRGGAKEFAPGNLTDQKRDTYWATDDRATTPEVTFEWPQPVRFNVVSLREYLTLGQRIEAFALDQWKDGAWIEFTSGTSIGNRRLLRIDDITTDRVRLRITQSSVCPALSEVGFFAEPVSDPAKH